MVFDLLLPFTSKILETVGSTGLRWVGWGTMVMLIARNSLFVFQFVLSGLVRISRL